MNPEQYNAITNTLATLVAGNEGINEHLRILNGKVAKHEEGLNMVLLWKAKTEGFVGGVKGTVGIGWVTVTTIVGGAFALFTYYISRLH